MDLSILIPLSDFPERTPAFLENLERTLPGRIRHEIILVENPATPLPHDLRATLRAFPRLHLLRHEGPPGRAASLNTAAHAAHASVFCLLTPGTTLMPGWLPPMLRLLRRDPLAGCIGNIHREPYSGLIEHAGIVFDADGLPVPAGRNEALLPREPFMRRPAVSVACCLVNRRVFDKIDGFDERFHAHFEDVDFCLRAAAAGYRHWVANRSVVYHHTTPPPDRPGDPDLALYRIRWGDRARVNHREREARRLEASFSPERWEFARETRRQFRQDVRDGRRDGRRYLRKHWFRPWRYNYDRVCRALVQSTRPLPAAVPRLPASFHDLASDGSGGSTHETDAVLFAPPRR